LQKEIEAIQQKYKIVGREEELGKALAAISASKHILFEGTVGVGKTVVATALAKYFERNFFRVDGDERYTEYKLTGWFDPALVVAKGYTREAFIPGPLTQAMTEGSFLFINELNRMPEGTQNVLLPAMDEGQVMIPKIAEVRAKPGFLVIATQNPEEFVGTSRLSEALRDRFVWIRLDYQTETEEQEIVRKETGCGSDEILETAVKIARKTRGDPDIRHGASVRAAIDMTHLIQRWSKSETKNPDLWIKAAIMALATRVELQDRTSRKLDEVIRNIVKSVLGESSADSFGETSTGSKKTSGARSRDFSTSNATREVRAALEEGNLSMAVRILQQNSQSISEILLDEELSKSIMKIAERSEPRWPALQLLHTALAGLDPKRRQIAKSVLNRMIRRVAAQIVGRGIHPTVRVDAPFRPGLEEFDLEETLENRLGKNFFDYHDIVCVERHPRKKAYSLILDASNSMQAEKILIAALTVGVFAYKFLDSQYSVITFKDCAHSLKPIEEELGIEGLIDRILDLQPGGSTNIQEALQKSLEELEKLRKLEGTGILITDGWVTKGGDPIQVAAKYPMLHVIQVPFGVGGGDSKMCTDLAAAGRGRYSYVREFYQLPQAILNIFK